MAGEVTVMEYIGLPDKLLQLLNEVPNVALAKESCRIGFGAADTLMFIVVVLVQPCAVAPVIV